MGKQKSQIHNSHSSHQSHPGNQPQHYAAPRSEKPQPPLAALSSKETTFGETPSSRVDDGMAIHIATYDRAGTLRWLQQAGSDRTDHGYTIVSDSQGNLYLSGACSGAAKFENELAAFGNQHLLMFSNQPKPNFTTHCQTQGKQDDNPKEQAVVN